jgi:hypothetical protein
MKQVVSQNTGSFTLRLSQIFSPLWAKIFGEITFRGVPKKLVVLTFQVCVKFIVCRLSHFSPCILISILRLGRAPKRNFVLGS